MVHEQQTCMRDISLLMLKEHTLTCLVGAIPLHYLYLEATLFSLATHIFRCNDFVHDHTHILSQGVFFISLILYVIFLESTQYFSPLSPSIVSIIMSLGFPPLSSPTSPYDTTFGTNSVLCESVVISQSQTPLIFTSSNSPSTTPPSLHPILWEIHCMLKTPMISSFQLPNVKEHIHSLNILFVTLFPIIPASVPFSICGLQLIAQDVSCISKCKGLEGYHGSEV